MMRPTPLLLVTFNLILHDFPESLVVRRVGLRGADERDPLAVVGGERPGAEELEVLVLVVVECLGVPPPLQGGESTELRDLTQRSMKVYQDG